MLPKTSRADKKLIGVIFKEGRSISSANLSFKFIKSSVSPTRVSFIVPKNIAKTSVKRNSLRRKGYIALSPLMNSIPKGVSGAFIYRKAINSMEEVAQEVKSIIKKL